MVGKISTFKSVKMESQKRLCFCILLLLNMKEADMQLLFDNYSYNTEARFNMLNESELAESNRTVTYAYIKTEEWHSKLNMKIWMKLFPNLDERLYLSVFKHEEIPWGWRGVFNMLYYIHVNETKYHNTVDSNDLESVSSDLNETLMTTFVPKKADIVEYSVSDSNTTFKITFASNETHTYVLPQTIESLGTYAIVGIFKFCPFAFLSTKINVLSHCRKRALYPYPNSRNWHSTSRYTLMQPFLLFSFRSTLTEISKKMLYIESKAEWWNDNDISKDKTLFVLFKSSTSLFRSYFYETNDANMLHTASSDVNKRYAHSFSATRIFMVTLIDGVKGFYQAIFASDGNQTFVILNYEDVDIESEEDIQYVEAFCNSKSLINTTASRFVSETSNIGTPGRHVFSLTSTNCSRPELYPFGVEHGDKEMDKGDNYAEQIHLNTSIALKSRSIDNFFVTTNGLISVDIGLTHEVEYDENSYHILLVPFFFDFDTTRGGWIYYRETQEEAVLWRANSDIRRLNENAEIVTQAVVITYFRVKAHYDESAWYHSPDWYENTFQVIIAHNGINSTYIILNYQQLDHQHGNRYVVEQPCYRVKLDNVANEGNPSRRSNVGLMGTFVLEWNNGSECEPSADWEVYKPKELQIQRIGYDYVSFRIIEKQTIPLANVVKKGSWIVEEIQVCADLYMLTALEQNVSYLIYIRFGVQNIGRSLRYMLDEVELLSTGPVNDVSVKQVGKQATLYWSTPVDLISDHKNSFVNITHKIKYQDEIEVHNYTLSIWSTQLNFNGSIGSVHQFHINLTVNGHSSDTFITHTFTEEKPSNNEVQMKIIIAVSSVVVVVIGVCIYLFHRYKKKMKRKQSILLPQGIMKLDLDKSILEQCNNLSYDTKFEFPRKQLSLVKVLGQGAFGQVWMATARNMESFKPRQNKSEHIFFKFFKRNRKKTVVAVKSLKVNATAVDYKDLANELKLLIHIGEHKNIVNLLGACTNDNNLLVILEYCANGALLGYLRVNEYDFQPTWRCVDDGSFNLYQLARMCVQIADGMNFLEEKKCVHRDLAARNILLTNLMTVKIADFGLARNTDGKDYYRKESDGNLPIKWMAPEAITNQKYTSKSDVWSFGILMWEIFSLGSCPYPSVRNSDVLDYIRNGKRMENPKYCPNELYQMMLQCWSAPVELRPSFFDMRNAVDQAILVFSEKFCNNEQPMVQEPLCQSSGTEQSSNNCQMDSNKIITDAEEAKIYSKSTIEGIEHDNAYLTLKYDMKKEDKDNAIKITNNMISAKDESQLNMIGEITDTIAAVNKKKREELDIKSLEMKKSNEELKENMRKDDVPDKNVRRKSEKKDTSSSGDTVTREVDEVTSLSTILVEKVMNEILNGGYVLKTENDCMLTNMNGGSNEKNESLEVKGEIGGENGEVAIADNILEKRMDDALKRNDTLAHYMNCYSSAIMDTKHVSATGEDGYNEFTDDHNTH